MSRQKWKPWATLSFQEKLARLIQNFGCLRYRRNGTSLRLHRLYTRALEREYGKA